MKSLFSPESGLMHFLSNLADLIILNILFFLFCLPCFTIGASLTAAYSVTLRFAGGQWGGVLQQFLKAFRADFKKSTLTFLILLLPWLLLSFELILLFSGRFQASVWVYALCYIPIILLFIASGLVFPLTAQFQNTIPRTLLNALLISLTHFIPTLLVALLNLLPVLCWYFMPIVFMSTGVIWLLFGASGIAYINSLLISRIFRQWIPRSTNE